MPAPKHKSRSLRRVHVKTASKVTLRYRKRKPSKSSCSDCGKDLKGVVRERANKLKTIAKSKKAPSRPFSNLCSSCSRKKLIERAKETKW